MLKDHVSARITRKRLNSGPAANHVDDFSDWLYAQGYKKRSLFRMLQSFAGWTDWLTKTGRTAEDFAEGLQACAEYVMSVPHTWYARGPRREFLSVARLFDPESFRCRYKRADMPLTGQYCSQFQVKCNPKAERWSRQPAVNIAHSSLDFCKSRNSSSHMQHCAATEIVRAERSATSSAKNPSDACTSSLFFPPSCWPARI